MTEYVCPVGALTATDFRFKARVWFLRSARTVCQGCATGCNAFLDYDPRTSTAYRHRPRENQAVNKYWMCDDGMLDYRRVHEGRILEASIEGARATVGEALDRAGQALSGIPADTLAVVLSAQHSNEDNFALLSLAKRLGAKQLFLGGKANGPGDAVLREADKNPNTRGVRTLASPAQVRTMKELSAAVGSGSVSAILALGADTLDLEGELPVRTRVVLATHGGPLTRGATVVLPAAGWAEVDGTFVNVKGIAQESEQAIGPQGDSRPAWKLIAGLSVRLDKDIGFRKLADVRAAQAPTAAAQGVAQGAE
jgi:NADH-quinone oxidoreductase subunit G